MVALPPSHGPAWKGACPSRFSMLSPAWQQLVKLMHIIGYGRIRDLPIRQGEPVFTPAPIIEFDIKPRGRDNGPRRGLPGTDFILKAEVTGMFAKLDRFGDCVIAKLEIRGGLPFVIVVRPLSS